LPRDSHRISGCDSGLQNGKPVLEKQDSFFLFMEVSFWPKPGNCMIGIDRGGGDINATKAVDLFQEPLDTFRKDDRLREPTLSLMT